MKRLLVAGVLAGAAFATTPASAAGYDVNLIVWTGENGRYGVGAEYSRDGRYYDPVGAAYVSNGRACVGFSYQIPLCVPLEIQVD